MTIQQILILIALLATMGNVQAAIYKWTDQNGRINYTESPPPGIDAERVDTVTGTSTTIAERERARQRLEQMTVGLDQSADSPEQTTDPADIAQQQKEACDSMRRNLAVLNTGGQLRTQNEQGELYYMSEEDITNRIQEINKRMASACQ